MGRVCSVLLGCGFLDQGRYRAVLRVEIGLGCFHHIVGGEPGYDFGEVGDISPIADHGLEVGQGAGQTSV